MCQILDVHPCGFYACSANPMSARSKENHQVMAFEHLGFWQPMDTLRDRNLLEELWGSGKAPWKIW
jgi:glucose-1-phosphate cytidylyltransferase